MTNRRSPDNPVRDCPLGHEEFSNTATVVSMVYRKNALTSGLKRTTNTQIPTGSPMQQPGKLHGIIARIVAVTTNAKFSRFRIFIAPNTISPLIAKPSRELTTATGPCIWVIISKSGLSSGGISPGGGRKKDVP